MQLDSTKVSSPPPPWGSFYHTPSPSPSSGLPRSGHRPWLSFGCAIVGSTGSCWGPGGVAWRVRARVVPTVDKATAFGSQDTVKPWKQGQGVRLAQLLPPGGRLPGLAGAQQDRSTHSLTSCQAWAGGWAGLMSPQLTFPRAKLGSSFGSERGELRTEARVL